MYLVVILVSLAALQLWGAKNPLHKDGLFRGWVRQVARWPVAVRHPWLQLTLVLAPPVGITAALACLLPLVVWLALATLVLLYSLGRGEFAPETTSYTLACNDAAWDVALVKAQRQGVDARGLVPGNWPQLHQRMLEATAYQGFERLFAVLFWFLLCGPAGALLYRLSFLFVQALRGTQDPASGEAAPLPPTSPAAQKWLWLMEWLPVRLLGASFAVTGNFVGCINRWKSHALSVSSTSASVLRETVLGALSVDDELMQSCDCTQREINALKRLLTRTLWFWMTCLAIATLLQK